MQAAPAQVDGLRTELLRGPYTIGNAVEALEDAVQGLLTLKLAAQGTQVSDLELEAALNETLNANYKMLRDLFASQAPALLFLTSEPSLAVTPRRAMLSRFHQGMAQAILSIRDDFMAHRERVSTALNELFHRMEHHADLMKLVKDSNAMTEDLWLKLVGVPSIKPAANQLLNLGLPQKAIYDALKYLVTLGVSAGIAAAQQ